MLSLRNIWIIVTGITLRRSPIIPTSSNLDIVTSDTNCNYPNFYPDGSNLVNFTCQYPSLIGWEDCGTAENRTCWLRNPTTGEEFNIHTDYEDLMPIGIDRNYTLVVADGWINADGLNFTEAKLFNNSFPGPLIEACWGDRVHIKVINQLKTNGTSIHWHGIRQNQTMHMDGVNGITQCPIAPGDSFTYSWDATQYGSSWYHSHYSVQYADGLQAPITIHGPSSVRYDEAIEPLIVTDWLHNSAFEALYDDPYQRDIVFGGSGNATGDIQRFNQSLVADLPVPKRYEIHFDPLPDNAVTKAKRYLLRLINTAWDSTFVFSIDNHNLTIVEADFVPVKPIHTTSVLVSIGQRYNIIVEASPVFNESDPEQNPLREESNYWIRTWIAEGCYKNGTNPKYPEMGILRYDSTSTADPTSEPWNVNLACSDTEINSRLDPIVPWLVGQPANGRVGEDFNVSILGTGNEGPYATSFISFDRGGSKVQNPFQTDYGNPTFLNLDNVGGNWPVGWVVVPENYTENDWVHMVLFGGQQDNFGPHPIHLHGHDFAILQEVNDQMWDPDTYNSTKNNLINPPRRDVVLLPAQGYVVIGFKTDNPGIWLMHCHIASHAAGGLSLQIMERQGAANEIWPLGKSDALAEAHRVCANWNSWAYDCRNYWPGPKYTLDDNGAVNSTYWPACQDAVILQNDSGV